MPDAMTPRPHKVVNVVTDTYDTATITLAPDGDPVAFAPGQFNMLYLYGVGECAISISSDPGELDTQAHTVRRVGNVTEAIHRLAVGDVVGVRGPFGKPWPVEVAVGGDVVIVAGGLGLPPVRPAIHAILADRERYGRVSLLVGARTPRDILYPEQLISWMQRPDLDVQVTVDIAKDGWGGHVGFVTDLIGDAVTDSGATTAYVCGPELMMLVAGRSLEHAGVDASRIYVSVERNMDCGIGVCGHCQLGPLLICRDGPVVPFTSVAELMEVVEL
jgi:NAD(P)H-flavin reductase